MATFSIVLGLALLLAALHPFTTYPLSLLALKRFARRPLSPDPEASREPDIAILMCAYNEAHAIVAKVENLLALQDAHPKIEILVYVDGATDGTADLLLPYRERIHLEVHSERLGKTVGMNRLMQLAQRPIVMFTDANVAIDRCAPARLMEYFADPEVGCVAGNLRYVNANASVTASSGSFYWRLEEWIKRLESSVGSCMGADGSLFAIRRALHAPPPADLCDDMFVSMRVLCAGKRVIQADDVVAFENLVTKQAEEFQRKVRIACQAFNAHRVLWPEIRRLGALSVYEYVSHKFLRWWIIYLLLGGAAFAALGFALLGYVLLEGLGLVLAACALLLGYLGRPRVLSQVWDVLVAFAGTGIGVLWSLRGKKFVVWAPATSGREIPRTFTR